MDQLDPLDASDLISAALALHLGKDLKKSFAGITGHLAGVLPALPGNTSKTTNNGATPTPSAALHDQANTLEEVTYFSAVAIRETQRLLLTFGLTGEQARQMTALTLDFAQETRQSAEAAAMFIGRTLAGEREGLTRYGIQLDTTKGKVDALTDALRKYAEVEGRQQPRYAEHFPRMARSGGPLMTSDFPTFDL
ncbi:MAG: hypothetical protein LBK99_21765 [Opitutaceae bacterium]|nr:hypothetical protein [Opitutaceae bacterium]